MKTPSLKLKDAFFEETEGILKKRRIPGNRYIAEAVEFYNRYHKQKELAKAFAKASTLARESSMEVNAEFDRLIDEGTI